MILLQISEQLPDDHAVQSLVGSLMVWATL